MVLGLCFLDFFFLLTLTWNGVSSRITEECDPVKERNLCCAAMKRKKNTGLEQYRGNLIAVSFKDLLMYGIGSNFDTACPTSFLTSDAEIVTVLQDRTLN